MPEPAPQPAPSDLVAEHAAALGRFAGALCDDPGAVADIVQETLVRAWQAWDLVRPTAVRAWLKRIALNVVRERRRASWQTRVDLTGEPPELAGDTGQPEPAALAAERALRVRAAIARLPADQAEAVRLRFLLDESYPDMAVTLGVPESTLRSRVGAAAGRLRAALADLEERP